MSGRAKETFQQRLVQQQRRRTRLRDRIQPVVARVLREHGVFHIKLAVALQNAIAAELVPNLTARTSRDRLLAESGARPVCWICTFPISLDVPDDDDGGFSIDHVVPRSDGGNHLGFDNLRAAHRICSHARSAAEVLKRA